MKTKTFKLHLKRNCARRKGNQEITLAANDAEKITLKMLLPLHTLNNKRRYIENFNIFMRLSCIILSTSATT